jgi:hypothetical protein
MGTSPAHVVRASPLVRHLMMDVPRRWMSSSDPHARIRHNIGIRRIAAPLCGPSSEFATRNWPAPTGKFPAGAVFGHATYFVAGFRYSAKGPVSRILSCAVIPLGAALPRTLISDLPGGFGQIIGTALRHRADAGRELCSGLATPSLFGLAPCGVYHASVITAGAVRSYRTFSPLPLREAVAVCFLWHWPSTGLDARVPDVIRHTTLWSSDFPPPAALASPRQRPPGPPASIHFIPSTESNSSRRCPLINFLRPARI